MQNSPRLVVLAATLGASLLALAGSASAATIAPNITADEYDNSGTATDTGCSLREAIQSANVDNAASQFEPDCTSGTGDDTIQLGVGEYTLTRDVVTNSIETGDLEAADVSAPNALTVVGQGRDQTSINGTDDDRIFDVLAANGDVVLSGLTVFNGTAPSFGGGISSGGNLTLQGVDVTGNVAASGGGGVSVSGNSSTLNLVDSSVDLNNAGGGGGGILLSGGASLDASGDSHIDDNVASGQGGAVSIGTAGAADITLGQGVTANGNDALVQGGALGLTGDTDTDVTITGAELNGNTVADLAPTFSARGGAVHYIGGGQVTITDTKIQNNTVQGEVAGAGALSITPGAGALTITRGLITGNQATADPNATDGIAHSGGAISVVNGSATIADSRVGLNTLTVNDDGDHALGGGIVSGGALTVDSSTIDNNAINGAGPGPLSGQGAGIGAIAPTGPTRLINSTVTDNVLGTAQQPTTGGGIYVNSATQPTTVAHSTFTENDANVADALAVPGGAAYTVRASIFAEDNVVACLPNPLVATGFIVDANESCAGTGDADLENTPAQLGPLSENGGPLYGGAGPALTRELLGPAPILDLVPGADCDDLDGNPLTVDQRNAPRPTGAGCEPGSFEVFPCEGVSAYVGGPGADVILAASFPGKESFAGLAGADTLTGDGDANRLCGGDDGDDITGGAGADRISGGDGNDDIFARDGVADPVISCGPGADTVETDEQGVDTIAADCETVDFTPTAPGGGGGIVVPAPSTAENPECEPLRQKVRRLTKKIKKADGKKKSKLKKKRKKARRQLRELGCAT